MMSADNINIAACFTENGFPDRQIVVIPSCISAAGAARTGLAHTVLLQVTVPTNQPTMWSVLRAKPNQTKKAALVWGKVHISATALDMATLKRFH